MASHRKKEKVKKGKGVPGNNEHQEIDRYEKGKSFEQKLGDIFKLMGFEVEYNRRIAGSEIDILIRKRKRFGSRYEGYICECKNRKKKVNKNEVLHYSTAQRSVINYSKDKNVDDFDLMIVSSSGFTDNAKQAAESLKVILITYNEILSVLMDFDTYLTNLINDFEGSELKRLYIEPDFFPERKHEAINGFQFIEEWLQEPERKQFSLLGDHGTGKTSFAKVLTYRMAKVYKEDPDKSRIPFLVDLQECKGTFSLKSFLQKQLGSVGVEPASADKFLKLLAEGHVLLIFDAFDEMATVSIRETPLSNFKQLNEAVRGNAKVILNSRTQYFRDKDEVDRILKKQGIDGISDRASLLLREAFGPEYEIVHLKKFSDNQRREYLQKSMGGEWKKAYQRIKSTFNLNDLSYHPVLLDMMVKTLPQIEKGAKEFNSANLYEVYTKLWFQREDRRLKITKEVKEELMEELAFRLWKEGKLCIHNSALTDMISIHLNEMTITERDLDEAVSEVRTASFLVGDDDGNFSFTHGSFQEFFIARKIRKDLLKENFDILDLKLLSKEIVFFFGHLVEGDIDTLRAVARVLESKYRKRISENSLFILYSVLKMVSINQQFSIKEDNEFSTRDMEAFKNLVQGHLPNKFNLQGAALSGWSLPYMFCRKANFTEAKMEDSDFNGTTFEDVEFNETYMKGADFSGSIFENVNFEQVEANRCNFSNCRFASCTFKNSDFSMSNFMDAEFESCTIEANDFTGAGFYHSDLDMKTHNHNCYFGAGTPVAETSKLSPVLVDQGHVDIISTVAISKDGRFMVSGSDDKTVKLWDLEGGRLIKTLKGHDRAVLSVFISPDNRWIVSGSSDHTVRLWDLECGHITTTLKEHKDWVTSVFISPDNRRIVSGSLDHAVKLWDLESGRLIKSLEGHEQAVLSVFVSPDNRKIVSGGDDKMVKLWNLENGHLIKTIKAHERAVFSVFVSPDNQRIVSCGDDKTVKLWDFESGRLIKTLEGHEDWVRVVFVSQDNRKIVSGGDDKALKLWDLESGDLIKIFEGHDNIVNSVCIKEDTRLIVSGSFDETIKVWDIKNGRLIRTLENNKDSVNSDITDPKNLHRLYYRDRLALYPARDLLTSSHMSDRLTL